MFLFLSSLYKYKFIQISQTNNMFIRKTGSTIETTVLFSNYMETEIFLQYLHVQITIYIVTNSLFFNKNISDHALSSALY